MNWIGLIKGRRTIHFHHGGSEGYKIFDNYMQACEFVRENFYREFNYDKYISWKIIDVVTRKIMNEDVW